MTLDKFRRIDLRLDKAYGYIPDNQFAKQGDYNGVELVVQLADNGVVKDQSGTQLLFKWGHNQRKNSGQKYFEALDLSQGVFKVTYPTQMLFEGTVTATIHIIQDGNIIPTRNFTLRVEKDPTNDNLVVAENDFSVLQEALLQVNEWNGKFEEKYNGLEEEYNKEINSLNRQLAQTMTVAETSTVTKTRIPNNEIPSSKLATTTQDDRIKLVNLHEEVHSAMTGQTSVGNIPENGTVTIEKLAPQLQTMFVEEGTDWSEV